jgi:hypothetical protein
MVGLVWPLVPALALQVGTKELRQGHRSPRPRGLGRLDQKLKARGIVSHVTASATFTVT